VTTVRDVLVDAERRLRQAGVPSPDVDAALIVSHVLGVRRTSLFLHDVIPTEQRVRIEQFITRRSSRMPLQHILGSAPFRRIELAVGPGVFIPRPETELLAEAAIRRLRDEPGDRIAVDLCAGSGALAIAMATEVDHLQVHAVELSDDAWMWLDRNLTSFRDQAQAIGSTVIGHHGDACDIWEPGGALASFAGRVAAVTCNPPYIPDAMVPREPEVRDHEPGIALFGGSDGLDVVRSIARTAAVLLQHGGLLLIEHADVQGIDAGLTGVPGVLAGMHSDDEFAMVTDVPVGRPLWQNISDRPDLNGLPRFTMATKWQAAR
jgi:release factor glutamine methyltransferase